MHVLIIQHTKKLKWPFQVDMAALKPITIISILLVVLVAISVLNSSSYAYEGFENASKSVIICKADWCGHCKKAAPEFNKLVAASPITLKDGTKATVKILDADKDKAEISKYPVRGYPTVLVVSGGQTTEYPGERTSDGIMSFLNTL
jgi:thiol-disulfide isomerase/thioredoxin